MMHSYQIWRRFFLLLLMGRYLCRSEKKSTSGRREDFIKTSEILTFLWNQKVLVLSLMKGEKKRKKRKENLNESYIFFLSLGNLVFYFPYISQSFFSLSTILSFFLFVAVYISTDI